MGVFVQEELAESGGGAQADTSMSEPPSAGGPKERSDTHNTCK